MATVNFSVPDEIKRRFNKVFANKNKSQLIAELMKKAIEEYEKQQQRACAIEALLKLRSKHKAVSDKEIHNARKKGRP